MAFPPSDDFYVYLTSYGSNNHSMLQHKFPNPIDFTQCQNSYEVALVELVMKKNFSNLHSFTIHVMPADEREKYQSISFQDGYFAKTAKFLEYLNYSLGGARISFDDEKTQVKGSSIVEFYIPKADVEAGRSTAQMTMKVKPGWAVYFPTNIANILGFRTIFHVNRSKDVDVIVPVYPKDLHTKFHNLMVLCPNVKMSNVDSRMFPILRLFNIETHAFNDVINLEWPAPIYLPLQNVDYMDKIAVLLTDSNGMQLTGMKQCETLILIHFRQKRL